MLWAPPGVTPFPSSTSLYGRLAAPTSRAPAASRGGGGGGCSTTPRGSDHSPILAPAHARLAVSCFDSSNTHAGIHVRRRQCHCRSASAAALPLVPRQRHKPRRGGGSGGGSSRSSRQWQRLGRHDPPPWPIAAAAAAAAAALVDPAVLSIANGLPIRECLEEVLLGLDRSSGLVLQAPPGAGKTTVVPLALLRHNPEYLRSGQRILVLEPRRVAAKGAARRMASSLREPVGGTVGYRVRLDSKVSSATRIEVVTEGILLRRLQHDPELAGVGAVVFDEFHERNLDADVALALCLDVQRLARPDLRLVVMSATLGGGLGDRVRSLMAGENTQQQQQGGEEARSGFGAGAVPLVLSEGRSYPVQTFHLGKPDAADRGSLERAVAAAVARALRDGGGSEGSGGGDVLAFLPGVGEIRTVERLLEEDGTGRKYGARLLQLHGNMAPDEQDEVLRPPPAGARRRRVILSTPIAESSVTIDGVTAVVDCGLRRAPRYDPSTAINRLATICISDASADQRRGRAGRTAPGRCYRLWSERDALPAVSEPEIITADLAPTVLDLALWGSPDGSGLPWLDPPPEDLLRAGRELLQDLGAVDAATGRATSHGHVLARLGVHPRWGHAVLRGAALGSVELAAVVATMLGSERDVLRVGGGSGPGGRSADIMLRLEALARDDSALDRAAAGRILQGARSMAAMAAATARRAAAAAPPSEDDEEEAVAAALSDAGVAPLESSADASEDEDNIDDSGHEAAADAARLATRTGTGTSSSSSSTTTTTTAAATTTTTAVATTTAAATTTTTTTTISTGGGGVVSARGRGGPSVSGASSSSSPASPASSSFTSSQSFDGLWREQLQREGLVGALVAAAYPDRIAERRDRSNKRPSFTLSTGQVVRLPSDDDPLGQCEYLAVAEIGGVGPAAAWRRDGGGNDTVRAAAGLSTLAVERYLKDMVQDRDVVFWASASKSVLARRQKRLGCLVLSERAVPVSDAAALPALLQGFKEMGGVRGVGLSRDLEAWRQRVVWLRTQAQAAPSSRLASLPDLSDQGLLASAARWLGPHLSGVRSKGDMLKLGWNAIIKSLVPRELQQLVEAEAPSHLLLPTGTRALVDYSHDQPVVRCKLQEVFGLAVTPRLAGGRVPITLELLSPAGRPTAVTSDLSRFWHSSYPEVRRELRGRYPRQVWPEDPLQAEATRLTKKQLEARDAAAAAAAAPGGGGKGGSGKGTSGGAGGGASGGAKKPVSGAKRK